MTSNASSVPLLDISPEEEQYNLEERVEAKVWAVRAFIDEVIRTNGDNGQFLRRADLALFERAWDQISIISSYLRLSDQARKLTTIGGNGAEPSVFDISGVNRAIRKVLARNLRISLAGGANRDDIISEIETMHFELRNMCRQLCPIIERGQEDLVQRMWATLAAGKKDTDDARALCSAAKVTLNDSLIDRLTHMEQAAELFRIGLPQSSIQKTESSCEGPDRYSSYQSFVSGSVSETQTDLETLVTRIETAYGDIFKMERARQELAWSPGMLKRLEEL
jgi:hypothetical protein